MKLHKTSSNMSNLLHCINISSILCLKNLCMDINRQTTVYSSNNKDDLKQHNKSNNDAFSCLLNCITFKSL